MKKEGTGGQGVYRDWHVQTYYARNMAKRKRATRSDRHQRKYGKQMAKKKKMYSTNTSKNMAQRITGSTLPVSLHYSTRVALNPGLGGLVASYQFRLGSIHDPDFSGVGHQPVGHDELANLYERYQVWKVEYHIEFTNRSTSENQCVGYRVSDVSSTSTDRDVNIENGNSEWTLIGYNGNGKKSFIGTVYPCTVHGISYKQYMANDDYGANFGSNPVEDSFLTLFVDGMGDDTDPVDCVIELVYHCKLMGSKLTALS